MKALEIIKLCSSFRFSESLSGAKKERAFVLDKAGNRIGQVIIMIGDSCTKIQKSQPLMQNGQSAAESKGLARVYNLYVELRQKASPKSVKDCI